MKLFLSKGLDVALKHHNMNIRAPITSNYPDPRPVKTYFLLAGEVKLVKIGCSVDPMARMLHLRTLNAANLEILVILDEQEPILHKMFQHLRHHGEWFRVDKEIVDYLRSENENEAANRLETVVKDA